MSLTNLTSLVFMYGCPVYFFFDRITMRLPKITEPYLKVTVLVRTKCFMT